MDVLICDDEPDVQFLLELTIQSLGYAARAVGNADDAVRACRDRLPDVLLLDVSMPGTDGPTLVRRLRASDLEPPRTTLVSAITRDDLRALADELGVGWVSKPFTRDQIATLLTSPAA